MRTHHLFKKPDTTVECKPFPIASESTSAPATEAQSHGTSQQDCLTIPRCAINGNSESGTFMVNGHQYYVSLRGRDASLAGCDDLIQQLHDNDEAKATWVPCQPDEIFIENKALSQPRRPAPVVVRDEEANAFHALPDENAAGARPRL